MVSRCRTNCGASARGSCATASFPLSSRLDILYSFCCFFVRSSKLRPRFARASCIFWSNASRDPKLALPRSIGLSHQRQMRRRSLSSSRATEHASPKHCREPLAFASVFCMFLQLMHNQPSSLMVHAQNSPSPGAKLYREAPPCRESRSSLNLHLRWGLPEFQHPLHRKRQRFLKVFALPLAKESLTMQASQIGVEQYRQGRGLEPFVCVGEAQRNGAACFSRFQYEV